MGNGFDKARFEGDDAVTSTFNLLVAAGAAVSKAELIDRLEKHPSYPSLEAVSDVLVELGLDVEATMLPLERARGSEPFLSLSPEYGFYVVLDLNDAFAEVVLPNHGVCRWDVQTARAHWSGIAIHARVPSPSERPLARSRFFVVASVLALCVAGLVAGIQNLGWAPVAMFVLCGLGLRLGLSLAQIERGASTGWASRLCKRVGSGCQSLLGSRASRLFGLRLTDVGVSYFAAWMVAALVGLVLRDAGTWTSLAVLSAAAGLFPFLSIAMQWRLKTWCPLCLLVQVVLFSQAIIAGLALASAPAPTLVGAAVVAGASVVAWFGWQLLSDYLRRLSILRDNERRYARIARRPEAVEAVLGSSRAIAFGSLPGDLSFGADTGVNLDLVLSLGCPSCRRVFAMLDANIEEIRREARVTIRVVGAPSPEDSSLWCSLPRSPTSIWAELRSAFAGQAQIPVEMARGSKAAEAWLGQQQIEAVPLILVDGRALPSDLKVEDVRYYLKNRAEALAEVESNRRAG